MDARDAELKKELAATLKAREELGEEYESELIDSFMAKLDQRVERQIDTRVRREVAQRQTSSARADRSPGPPAGGSSGFGFRHGVTLFSLVAAIPLSAIAAAQAGEGGLAIVWAGIVGVNVAQACGAYFVNRQQRAAEREDWS